MSIKTFIFITWAIVSSQVHARWLKGDLHTHTTYSDGDNSVYEVLNAAKKADFDFMVITDHDTWMAGKPLHWEDLDYRDNQMTLLYGVEWTTLKGHANIFSHKMFDYEKIWMANQEQNAQMAVDEAHKQDAIFSINHPNMMFGLEWNYEIPENVDSIEVWNGVYRLQSRNAWSITKFWDVKLLAGQRVTGLGGSDTHKVYGTLSRLKNVGIPTTWVDSNDLDGKSILKAIKMGRVSISFSPDAPVLELLADNNQDRLFEIKTGDNIISRNNIDFKIKIHNFKNENKDDRGFASEFSHELTEAFESGKINVIDYLSQDKRSGKVKAVGVFKNGKLFKTWKISGKVKEIVFSDQVKSGEKCYYRVELIGKPSAYYLENLLLYGKTIALTNPIYVNY